MITGGRAADIKNSLKESLNKMNKTKVIKNLIRGYQKPLNQEGVKGLLKKKIYGSDDENAPHNPSPI